MVKQILGAFAVAARALFRKWGALLILLALYGATLGCVYLFFATREATLGQLVLTFALPAAALFLLSVIQTISVSYTGQANARRLATAGLKGFWKVLVIAVPVVLPIGFAMYLLGRIGVDAAEPVTRLADPQTAPPVEWQAIALTSLQYLLGCIVAPLVAIHLWGTTVREGLKAGFGKMHHSVARAFAAHAVLTYAIGFVVFAVIPYLLLFTRTPASGWVDVGLVGVRLVLAAVISLVGWVITVGALGELAVQGAAVKATATGQADKLGGGNVQAAAES
jgi:hypothetical protein